MWETMNLDRRFLFSDTPDSVVPSTRYPQLFAQYGAKRLFQFWRFAFHVLTQSFVDQRLIADCSAGGIGLLQEMIHQVFIQANRDTRFTERLRLWSGDPPALALTVRSPEG